MPKKKKNPSKVLLLICGFRKTSFLALQKLGLIIENKFWQRQFQRVLLLGTVFFVRAI